MDYQSKDIIPVIISGGAGTRLWPLSRQVLPKPFIKLSDGYSLLQKTFMRAAGIPEVSKIISVTNQDYYFKTEEEIAALGLAAKLSVNYLLEPLGRNTAPAIAIASLYAQEICGKNTKLLILPADHIIQNSYGFLNAVKLASDIADDNCLVTFGIPPIFPDTSLGYIECAENYGTQKNAFSVKQFVEKPTPEKANLYFKNKNFFWNSGMFCFKASNLLQALSIHNKLLYENLLRCWESVINKNSPVYLTREMFEKLESISIDYALMEKANNVVVVKAEFDWNDVGSWKALNQVVLEKKAANYCAGESLEIASQNCNIHSHTRLVATLGVKDLTIVDTPDALLVADNNHLQRVPEVVSILSANKHKTYFSDRTVCRPWGSYTVLEEGEGFKIKRIIVKPGGKLSLQLHHHRNEHWIIISGTATVIAGEKQVLIYNNQSFYISAGTPHRLMNLEKTNLILIEVQTGQYLGEDDIVRLDDQYGRILEKNLETKNEPL